MCVPPLDHATPSYHATHCHHATPSCHATAPLQGGLHTAAAAARPTLLSSSAHQVRATESKGMIHQMWYDLEGVDSLCNRGPDSSISELLQPETVPLQPATPCTQPATLRAPGNSCGIHIHKGTSCTSDALGHLYNPVGGLETVSVVTAAVAE